MARIALSFADKALHGVSNSPTSAGALSVIAKAFEVSAP
jgi:hypothetical protein